MKQEQEAAVWKIRPLGVKQAASNGWTRRISASLHKWVNFAESEFRLWPNRPNAGHFFGGAYWYELETVQTAAIYAVLASFTEPGVEVRYNRAQLTDRAIKAIRYLGFTHDTGPEDCVRDTSKIPLCSGNKWGGRQDRYFVATQVGGSMYYFGLAAWLLWDQLDDETRVLVQNTISSYADRWADEEPRNGTYYDTQLEENAWTGIGIFTAAMLFPEHPRNAHWWAAYHKWNVNSMTTFRDRLSHEPSRGVPLRSRVSAITLHPDYTTENHAFVHPTYMAASLNFRGRELAELLLAGMPADTIDMYNDREMYERTLKRWAEADGIPSSVQGQDWWYNQQHGFLHGHALMNVLHGDGEAARLEEMALSTIEALQNSNNRGCYLEQHGEDCIIVAEFQQAAIDMEHVSAAHMLNTYLLHKLGGNGAEPADRKGMEARLAGVRVYPYGGLVTHRTETTFTSFSWRNHAMALSLPRSGCWLQTPLFESYTGIVRLSRDEGASPPINESFVTDSREHHADVREDGFAAYALLERGNKHLLQHVGFVSLPDGRSLYWEQFEALESVALKTLHTGVVGIRNEYYRELPDWAKGYRELHLPDQMQRFESWRLNSSDTVADYPSCHYLNIDDKAGYLLYGSSGIRYHNQHVHTKWKGGEDRLILNCRAAPVALAAGERTGLFVIVNLPNFTTAQTAEVAGRGRLYEGRIAGGDSGDSNGVLLGAGLWQDGRYLVYFNNRERSAFVSFSEVQDGKPISLYPGDIRIGDGAYKWSGRIPARQSGYYACKGTIELVAGKVSELSICVTAQSVIFMNRAMENISFQYTHPGQEGRSERIALEPGAFYQLHII